MALTTTLANSVLSNLVNGATIGLSLTAPHADGTGVTEPSGGGYERATVQSNSFEVKDRVLKNTKYIYFPEATGAWGNVAYLCIYKSGVLQYYGALTSTINITANSVPLFRPESIRISLDA